MNSYHNLYHELDTLHVTGRKPDSNVFQGEVCHLSDREAMGLPDYYLVGGLDKLEHEYALLAKLDKAALATLVESKAEPFKTRFAAGQLLALFGDPRINIYNPNMIRLPAWSGILGLNPEKIDFVVKEFEKYGIHREWIAKETPEYPVAIESFKIGRYPVTNYEYLAFLDDSQHNEIPTSWVFRQYSMNYANHPVYSLSSEACVRYAEWLSNKTGRKFRLPTEAEWEYAAGGPERNEYPWGSIFLADHANTVESGIFQTTPVGIFPKGASPFGCLDMAGNVEEFVQDQYASYPGGAVIEDDLVAVNGTFRVARGGSFTRFRDLARCRRRHGRNPKAIYTMGFRLAEDI